MSKLLKTGFLTVIAVAILLSLASRAMQGEQARVVPAPALDEPAGSRASEVAIFAGGCFWGVQGVYQHTKGVTNAISGYAGGDEKTAEYEIVSTGRTGHAESVQVWFDPRVISYGKLLQVFFSVVHDPTELNRQGPDTGTQYRSAIFPTNADQARVAKAYLAQLAQASIFKAPIVTTIELDKPFFRAEAYHQDFLELNPTYPYIVFNDIPKVKDLNRMFPELYQVKPVLVGAAK